MPIKKNKKLSPTKKEFKWVQLVEKKIQSSITVGDLISQLEKFPKESKLYFSGLDFYRLKARGQSVQVEFAQNVYLSKNCKIKIDELED